MKGGCSKLRKEAGLPNSTMSATAGVFERGLRTALFCYSSQGLMSLFLTRRIVWYHRPQKAVYSCMWLRANTVLLLLLLQL
jgi:hypothetical protein